VSTPAPDTVIVRTGTANLASVCAAFARLGAEPCVSDDPARIMAAPLVVLPGVGAFGAAMANLRAVGLDDAVRERARRERPLLAICLGMHLLCESSEESPGIAGLGIAPGAIRRFSGDVRVPQMGWNRVSAPPGSLLPQNDYMYFANSFRLKLPPPGWDCATTTHRGPFVSAMHRGSTLACQFHPELSGAAGLGLLRRWLALAAARTWCPC